GRASLRFQEMRDFAPGSSFSPDGKTFVTSISGRIWRIDVASGTKTPIPFTVDVEQPVGALTRFDYRIPDTIAVRVMQNPRLSHDGKQVVVSAVDRLWIADIANASTARVTPRRLTAASMTDGQFFPEWSPDDRFIAFASWSDTSGGALYEVSAGDAWEG